jgi:hypothetical protein
MFTAHEWQNNSTAPHVRLDSTHHAHGLGEASELARACGIPVFFFQLHRRCTRSPPNKLVRILFNYQCGINHL